VLTAAGLLWAGAWFVMKPQGDGDEGMTKSDLSQLSQAISAWQVKFELKEPFPSRIKLCEDYSQYDMAKPLDLDSIGFLQRVWPRLTTKDRDGKTVWNTSNGWIDWDGNKVKASEPFVLEGQECLVFFLGGIPTSQNRSFGCTGFSTNPSNPAYHVNNPYSTVIPPFFSFDAHRLQIGQSGAFFHYLDGFGKQPYAYFSSYKTMNGYNRYLRMDSKSDCSALAVWPYADAPNRYLNPNTFQIISAGQDGIFGSGSPDPNAGPFFTPEMPMYRPGQGGYDDMNNFYERLLGERGR
jgi:hypothetical protein